MKAAYAGCTSYQDEGLRTHTYNGSTEIVLKNEFSTRFVRNRATGGDSPENGFKLELRQQFPSGKWAHDVVWVDGGNVRTWSSVREVQLESGSLRNALARVVGISGRVSIEVPLLLMPELSFSSKAATDFKLRLMDEPTAAAEGCVVIERTGPSGVAMQYWIDSSTFMIHRIVKPRPVGFTRPSGVGVLANQGHSHPSGTEDISINISAETNLGEREVVAYYAPKLNAQVQASALRFKPPCD